MPLAKSVLGWGPALEVGCTLPAPLLWFLPVADTLEEEAAVSLSSQPAQQLEEGSIRPIKDQHHQLQGGKEAREREKES